ncbi:helix-turn-helix domain-containing protein [Nonomuraea rhodomycinica]|uniref:Helix-turn-helix domain-containing protein n=1 Tax=Nonomuraea rhodomycinica TaxID=1712872 RepID=A0A7Y6IRC3_9ACTN|nr:helix-turn-helix domain-containing protein [Nonomuraea rhodomycinica]NUW42658.1 helix-turn-helix domain-containing protein [Nonomuraea rhodomycinica]
MTVAELVEGGPLAGARMYGAGRDPVRQVRIVDELAVFGTVAPHTAVVLIGAAAAGGWAVEMAVRRAWEQAAACVIAPSGGLDEGSGEALAERLGVTLVFVDEDPLVTAVHVASAASRPEAARTQLVARCATRLAGDRPSVRRVLGVLNAELPGTSVAFLDPYGDHLAGRRATGRGRDGWTVEVDVADADGATLGKLVAGGSSRSPGWPAVVRTVLELALAPLAAWAATERLRAWQDFTVQEALAERLLTLPPEPAHHGPVSRQAAPHQVASRQVPPHEVARQEAAREEVAREVAAREVAAREVAAREEVAREEVAVREPGIREGVSHDPASHDPGSHDLASHEAASHGAASREAGLPRGAGLPGRRGGTSSPTPREEPSGAEEGAYEQVTDEVRAAAAALGWAVRGPLTAYLVRPAGGRPDAVRARALIAAALGPVPVVRRGEGWAGWSGVSPDELAVRLRRCVESTPWPCAAGAGAPVGGLGAAEESLLGAEAAAFVAGPGTVARADRMGPAELLGAIPADALRAPASVVLRPLLAVDRDGTLLRTLAAVLDEGGALKAAERLGVHRNTVTTRIERIRAAGFDLEDAATRLALQLACRVLLP